MSSPARAVWKAVGLLPGRRPAEAEPTEGDETAEATP